MRSFLIKANEKILAIDIKGAKRYVGLISQGIDDPEARSLYLEEFVDQLHKDHTEVEHSGYQEAYEIILTLRKIIDENNKLLRLEIDKNQALKVKVDELKNRLEEIVKLFT